MAYDEELAERIRQLVGGGPGVTEKKMFGGLAFLVGGNMAVAASGQGGILVRVDPEESDALVATTPARPMEMRGREMRGWLRVGAEDVRAEGELEKWVARGVAYARLLPGKD
ncbi:MAG: TfoX/Sxy family protein [Actinomycetota bacterium]|nr:TfoX/Sxy family protein [Actinomycetota bacterium]